MTLFLMAFDRDVDYENPAQLTYLDLLSGSVIWFLEEDEDAEMYGLDTEENAAQRNRIGRDQGGSYSSPASHTVNITTS